MKIYTKTGDDGTTALFDGSRVGKDDARVDTYGHVDETNSLLGVVAAHTTDSEIIGWIHAIQKDLFALGAQLANPSKKKQKSKSDFNAEKCHFLEQIIDLVTDEVGTLTSFVLPGGSKTAAFIELARTVCRRAERHVVTLMKTEKIDQEVLIYLNRLSDFLFMLARLANKREGKLDILWE